MHKKSTVCRHYPRGEIVEKKKEQPVPQELRDQPVPPVKGAVTDWQDAVLRPDRAMEQNAAIREADFGSWL